MSSITLSAGLGAAIGGLATAPLGVPQIFYVPAVLTGLGTLGMVYVAYRCKPSSVSFVISGPPGIRGFAAESGRLPGSGGCRCRGRGPARSEPRQALGDGDDDGRGNQRRKGNERSPWQRRPTDQVAGDEKITSSRRRMKARNAFVGAASDCSDMSLVGLAAGTDASQRIGSLGSFCTMRVFMSAHHVIASSL